MYNLLLKGWSQGLGHIQAITVPNTIPMFFIKINVFYTHYFSKTSADQQKQKTKAQVNRNNRAMIFMSKQVSLPKISLILLEMKINPKSDIRLFAQKPSNVIADPGVC